MASTDPQFDECARNAWRSPRSAMVHKGEPPATDSAKLWFRLTPDEDARLDTVLADSLARYEQLSASEDQRSAHISTMSELMRKQGLDTALTEVYRPRDDEPAATGSIPPRQEPAGPPATAFSGFRGMPRLDVG